MKDDNRILSVGIDIGTTTTSMIVSRLAVENTAMVYMAPNVELTSKQIIYRSPVYLTPLLDQETLDGEEIKRIIEKEYASAGIRPEDVDSGAVIITGESALKENARLITDKLSEFAGDFVTWREISLWQRRDRIWNPLSQEEAQGRKLFQKHTAA